MPGCHQAWQNFKCWTLAKFSTKYFHTCCSFYNFVPLLVTLTVAGNHMVSSKQNHLASFSYTLFDWSEWHFVCCQSYSWRRGKYLLFYRQSRKYLMLTCIWTFLICFKLNSMTDAFKLYIFIFKSNWPCIQFMITGVQESPPPPPPSPY